MSPYACSGAFPNAAPRAAHHGPDRAVEFVLVNSLAVHEPGEHFGTPMQNQPAVAKRREGIQPHAREMFEDAANCARRGDRNGKTARFQCVAQKAAGTLANQSRPRTVKLQVVRQHLSPSRAFKRFYPKLGVLHAGLR
jgi:hypothetical protein